MISNSNELVKLAHRLFKQLYINLSYKDVKDKLHSSPKYPNIDSLIHLFDQVGINSKLVKGELVHLKQMHPFIIIQTLNDGYVLIEEINESHITYYTPNSGRIIDSFESLNKKWNGTILLLDYSNIKEQYLKPQKTGFFDIFIKWKSKTLFFIFIAIAFYYLRETTINMMYLGIKFSGLFVCLYLNHISLSGTNGFCELNKKFSCKTALRYKISNGFTLVDIGSIYFISGIVICLSTVELPSLLLFQTTISLSATIFIILSLYIQHKVLEKWCVICLLVIFLLILEITISVYYFNSSNFDLSIQVSDLIYLITTYIIVGILWFDLYEYIERSYKYHILKNDYLRIKSNKDVFNVLQQKEKKVDIDIVNEIKLGTSNSNKKLSIIFNPECEFCKEKLVDIVSVLKHRQNDICFYFIFTNAQDNSISLSLIELYYQLDQLEFINEIENFIKNGTKGIKSKNKNQKISKKSINTLEEHVNWCYENNIIKLPVLVFNGNTLTPHYSIPELDFK